MLKPQKLSNGTYVVNVNFKRKRKKLTLGMVSRQEANAFCANLALLCDYRRRQMQLTPQLKEFVSNMTPAMFKSLASISLIRDNENVSTVRQLVAKFLKDYKDRDDLQESTKTRMDRAMRRFPNWFFDLEISEVEPGIHVDRRNAEAEFTTSQKKRIKRVESYMREHYASATWSKTHNDLRQVGNWAVRRGYVDANPFSLLPSPGEKNDSRNVYVPAEWVEDCIEQARESDIRVSFAFGRYAGLRLHSELRAMKWKHIDLDAEFPTFTPFDSKKRSLRQSMPIFPELHSHLVKHRDETKSSGTYVLSNWARDRTDNFLYKQMVEAVNRTEHARWDRLRQNLRTSCENDLLAAGNPEYLVTAWIGHSVKVSREHYQKVTQKMIEQAFERNSGA